MALLIATVGTSLLTNRDEPGRQTRPWTEWRFGIQLPDEGEAARFLGDAAPELASAETHTLHKLPMLEGDRLTLLHSDTAEGAWCARALAAHYRTRGHEVGERRIAGIGYKAGPFAEQGLSGLISAAFGEIRRASKSGEAVTLCATGGFKAETAIMSLVGLLTGTRVVYIHELFRDMIEIPSLPIGWNLEFVERNAHFFEWIEAEPRGAIEASNRLRSCEPGLAALVEEADDGCAYLSAAGELLYQAYRDRADLGAPAVWPRDSDRTPDEKNAVSRTEHHRPDGWERFVERITRLGCVEFVRFDGQGDGSARSSRIVERDPALGVLRVVYVSGEHALPLIVETTARSAAELQLVESYVRRAMG